MSLLARFVSINRGLCGRIESLLPADFRVHLSTLYERQVAEFLNGRPGQVVLEVGAGRNCIFFPFLTGVETHLLIGTDVSEHELRYNQEVATKLVADAVAPGFPLCDDSVDLVVSHSLVEHLPDNTAFFANCASVIRPGGELLHTFPCKFAPFSLINQLVPNWLARRLLAWFHPHWRQEAVGFPAYYDCCYFSRIKKLLTENGFEKVRYRLRYYQSIYFDFFVPLYLIMLVYDLTVWYFEIKNLACGILIAAEKPAHPV